jgi:hypothetical protein
MIFTEDPAFDSRKTIMHKAMAPKDTTGRAPKQASSSNPAAGLGKVPKTDERMDAIRNIETMAGSPDADRHFRSASRHLAHGLLVFGPCPSVNP